MTPQKRVCLGWKGVRPGVRLESWSGEPVRRPEEHKRKDMGNVELFELFETIP